MVSTNERAITNSQMMMNRDNNNFTSMTGMSPGNKLRQSHTKQSMFAAAQISILNSSTGTSVTPFAQIVEMEEEEAVAVKDEARHYKDAAAGPHNKDATRLNIVTAMERAPMPVGIAKTHTKGYILWCM